MPQLVIPPVVLFSAAFLLVALAAKSIGAFFSRYGLPYITGYLLAGALAGPFILEMLPTGATDELNYINNISLAVIAFIAGSELYLKELQDRLRGILLNAAGIVVAATVIIGVALYFLQSLIPFTAGLDPTSKVAVSVLGATILLALSPASTIAVIQEVRAKGPFSKTVLSITVVMDVVIIVLFAVSVAIASTLLEGDSFTATFIVVLLIDIAIALAAGYVLGLLFSGLLSTNLPDIAKIAGILLAGFLIYESSYIVPTLLEDILPFKIKIEPLLISMVAGFTMTNFTRHREEFEHLLHDISPYVYVAFFALTGVALKLDVLVATLGIALALFAARMLAIFIGTYVGGTLAGEPQNFRRFAWLGLITQAGIALGLAREAAVEFPDTLGSEFATLLISVVVLNEIFGPLLLKFALRRSGEAHERGKDDPDEIRDAVLLGIEPQSIALARQLESHGWRVILADMDGSQVEYVVDDDGLDERHLQTINEETMAQVLTKGTDAMVAMLPDDADNLRACEIAYEHYGLRNMIVRLRTLDMLDEFEALGVRVVDPGSAIVTLLDQYVRAPDAARLLMHRDPDYDVVQVTVTDNYYDGVLLRDLRLPTDVLILEISRNGEGVVPHGYSKINVQDELTLVGKPDSLKKATLQLGF